MPDELKKIDLPIDSPIKPESPKRKINWKKLKVPAIIIGAIFLLLLILLLPLRGVIAQGRQAVAAGRLLLEAAKNQDLAKAKEGLAATRKELEDVQREFNKIRFLKFIPYIADLEHGINAALAGISAGDKAIEALEPNADLLGLKGESKFVQGSADDRIQTAVKTMSALTPKVNEMALHIDTLRKELNQINPNRYPKKIGKTVIRERLASTKETVENAANLFVNAQPLLINLPAMLGEPQTRRYLILFQNDKELRATGGFITAYAQFRLERGKMILERADDIYNLDNAKRKTFPAPREITTFHK
ncbi:MAG: hypothetical protein ACD_36C00171G0004, partial [uncultured bacterium]